MTRKILALLSEGELISEFENAANSFGQAFEKGTRRESNKVYRHCESVRAEILRRGKSAVDLLLGLLDSPQLWVRYTAAAYTLEEEPTRATAVLAGWRMASIRVQSAELPIVGDNFTVERARNAS